MKQILINEISIEELLIKLAEFIEKRQEQKKPESFKKHSVYLTRLDATKLLKISLPSLTEYTKKGWLQSYKIGNRILYKYDEVEKSIEKLATYKKRGL
jgi:hypothetical protein